MSEWHQTKWLLPIILAIMTLVTSGLLMLSHDLTAEQIAEQKMQAKLASSEPLVGLTFLL